MKSALKKVSLILAICFVAFHLYTAAFGTMPGIAQKSIHLGFLLVIFYINAMVDSEKRWEQIFLGIMALFALGGCAYITILDENLQLRAGIVYASDILFAILLIIAIFEACRRKMGNPLVIITLVFVAYAFLGKYIPGFLNQPGMTLKKFTSLVYLTTDGIFGSPLYASASYVVLFVLLGAIMSVSGIGDYMTNLATSLFGHMRGGPATGQPTCTAQDAVMQARYGGHGDYEIIALTPSSVQEAFDFTLRAFNLADKYRVPVFVLSDETVGHTREKLVIPETVEIFDDKYEGLCHEYFKPDEKGIPPRIRFFEGHNVLVDGQLHDERGVRQGTDAKICSAAIRRYCSKIRDNIDDITSVERFYLDGAETVIVAYGSVSRSALSAVNRARAEGLSVGMLKLNTVWPVPEKEIREACAGAKRVIVPEMNVGQYLREVQRVVGMDKVTGFSSIGGAFPHPSAIYSKIVEVK